MKKSILLKAVIVVLVFFIVGISLAIKSSLKKDSEEVVEENEIVIELSGKEEKEIFGKYEKEYNELLENNITSSNSEELSKKAKKLEEELNEIEGIKNIESLEYLKDSYSDLNSSINYFIKYDESNDQTLKTKFYDYYLFWLESSQKNYQNYLTLK